MGSQSPHPFDFSQCRLFFRKGREKKDGAGGCGRFMWDGHSWPSLLVLVLFVAMLPQCLVWVQLQTQSQRRRTGVSVPHFLSLLTFSTTVRARATDNLRAFEPSLGERGFGECTPASLRSSLAFGGRDRTILPARPGRSNLEVC